MQNSWLLGVVLFFAVAAGFFLGRRSRRKKSESLPLSKHQYFEGLNFLLNEQPDKAIEIFINALEVSEDTVETHLALANIFRKRGEMDRAILVHQNLLSHSGLQKIEFEQVQLELAQDYLEAGVFDRAEKILTGLVDIDSHYSRQAKTFLLHIFEVEKDWPSAIAVANSMVGQTPTIKQSMAHYCCELAEKALANDEYPTARRSLKRALDYDNKCARANLLLGRIEYNLGNYKAGIKAFRRVRHQNNDYFSEVLDFLALCYEAIGEREVFVEYLKRCLDETPTVSAAIVLAQQLRIIYGDEKAIGVIAEHVKNTPSIRGVHQLITMNIHQAAGKDRENLGLVQALVERLLERSPGYQCSNCGFNGKVLHWMCPGCQQWGTVSPLHGLEGR